MVPLQRRQQCRRPLRAAALRRVLGRPGKRAPADRTGRAPTGRRLGQGTCAHPAEERGDLALAIGTAKVAASRHGLDICNRLFEVTGARATHASLRFDRHWRNLRTQTLHDPVDYRIHELGEWALNDKRPAPSFYS